MVLGNQNLDPIGLQWFNRDYQKFRRELLDSEKLVSRVVGNLEKSQNRVNRRGRSNVAQTTARNVSQVSTATNSLANVQGRAISVITNFTSQLGFISPAALTAASSLGVAGAAVGAFLLLGRRGVQTEGLINAFNRTTLSIDELRTAARGAIPDLTLVRNVNLAVAGTRGELRETFERAIPKFLTIAGSLAEDTGQDFTFLFDSLVRGSKRASPLIIDNTGLVIKIGEATESYAKSIGSTVDQLSAAQRSIAVVNAVLEGGADALETAATRQESNAIKLARISARITNTLDVAAFSIQPLFGIVLDLTDHAIGAIEDITRRVAPFVFRIGEFVRNGLEQINMFVGPIVQPIGEVLGFFVSGIGMAIQTTLENSTYLLGLFLGAVNAGVGNSLLQITGLNTLTLSGFNATFNSFLVGLDATFQTGVQLVVGFATAVSRLLSGSSPPPEGPLSTFDRGGRNTALSWIEAFAATSLEPIESLAGRVVGVLGLPAIFTVEGLINRLDSLNLSAANVQKQLEAINTELDVARMVNEKALSSIDRQIARELELASLGDAQALRQIRFFDMQREIIQSRADAEQDVADMLAIQLALLQQIDTSERGSASSGARRAATARQRATRARKESAMTGGAAADIAGPGDLAGPQQLDRDFLDFAAADLFFNDIRRAGVRGFDVLGDPLDNIFRTLGEIEALDADRVLFTSSFSNPQGRQVGQPGTPSDTSQPDFFGDLLRTIGGLNPQAAIGAAFGNLLLDNLGSTGQTGILASPDQLAARYLPTGAPAGAPTFTDPLGQQFASVARGGAPGGVPSLSASLSNLTDMLSGLFDDLDGEVTLNLVATAQADLQTELDTVLTGIVGEIAIELDLQRLVLADKETSQLTTLQTALDTLLSGVMGEIPISLGLRRLVLADRETGTIGTLDTALEFLLSGVMGTIPITLGLRRLVLADRETGTIGTLDTALEFLLSGVMGTIPISLSLRRLVLADRATGTIGTLDTALEFLLSGVMGTIPISLGLRRLVLADRETGTIGTLDTALAFLLAGVMGEIPITLGLRRLVLADRETGTIGTLDTALAFLLSGVMGTIPITLGLRRLVLADRETGTIGTLDTALEFLLSGVMGTIPISLGLRRLVLADRETGVIGTLDTALEFLLSGVMGEIPITLGLRRLVLADRETGTIGTLDTALEFLLSGVMGTIPITLGLRRLVLADRETGTIGTLDTALAFLLSGVMGTIPITLGLRRLVLADRETGTIGTLQTAIDFLTSDVSATIPIHLGIVDTMALDMALMGIGSSVTNNEAVLSEALTTSLYTPFQTTLGSIVSLFLGAGAGAAVASLQTLLSSLDTSIPLWIGANIAGVFGDSLRTPIETELGDLAYWLTGTDDAAVGFASRILQFFTGDADAEGSLQWILEQGRMKFAAFPGLVSLALRGWAVTLWNVIGLPAISIINHVLEAFENFILNLIPGYQFFRSIGVDIQEITGFALGRVPTNPPSFITNLARGQEGGLFSRGAALVGEAGPELIVSAEQFGVFPAQVTRLLNRLENSVLGQSRPFMLDSSLSAGSTNQFDQRRSMTNTIMVDNSDDMRFRLELLESRLGR